MKDRPVIRRAERRDIDGIVAVKSRLSMPREEEATSTGGFLLGSSRDWYEAFVDQAFFHVLEDPERGVVGFAIALGDELMRSGEIWGRRSEVEWLEDVSQADAGRVAYFEQLAILPERRYRLYAPSLALAPYRDLIQTGHTHLFATVVRKPIHNKAAIPLLTGIGARLVGRIEEEYDGVGRLVSDIYMVCIDRPSSDDPVENTPLGGKVRSIFSRLAE